MARCIDAIPITKGGVTWPVRSECGKCTDTTRPELSSQRTPNDESFTVDAAIVVVVVVVVVMVMLVAFVLDALFGVCGAFSVQTTASRERAQASQRLHAHTREKRANLPPLSSSR
jgi:hypothetical protein